MIALYIYLSGGVLTALVWLLILQWACPERQYYWGRVRRDRNTLLVLGLFWFILVPLIGGYLGIKKLGYIIYRFSNGKVMRRAI